MSFEDSYRLSSHAVITDSSGRVLLLKANYNNGFWGLPGGAVDPGETIDKTLYRECLEELNCKIKILYLSGVYYHKKHNSHAFIFRCELESDDIRLSSEHSEYKYLEISKLTPIQRIRAEDCLNFKGQVMTAVFD